MPIAAVGGSLTLRECYSTVRRFLRQVWCPGDQMTRIIPIRFAVSCAAAVALLGLWPVAVDATAVLVSQAVQDVYLESGGTSCHDPYSWVWSASRAERVFVDVDPGRPCEIGASGCHRQPESLLPSSDHFDSINAVCGLKSKQHASSEQSGEFNNEACVQAESRAVLENVMITIDYSDLPRGPACTRDDPRCQSLPPIPASVQPPAAPTASGVTQSPNPLVTVVPGAMAFEADFNLLDGVRRRVERPPTTI